MHYLDPSNDWSKRLAAEPGTGQLNPVHNKTYAIVNKVIKEVASLFTDDWFHGGGDEPVYNCWNKDKSVRNYMKDNNATGLDLLSMFLEKELTMIRDSSKTPIIWEGKILLLDSHLYILSIFVDPVTNNDLPISNDTVLQVWINPVQLAVKKGYKVIASSHKFWYLDCGHGGWKYVHDKYSVYLY
jgi:hexosaminidase